MLLEAKPRITGVMLGYYLICKRKLWLFAKGLNMENISGNADVIKGRDIPENRFKREKEKEIELDNIKIDFLKYDGKIYVHEIKKSKKFEEAHKLQLKYYIYELRRKGVLCDSGIIHYPASMRKVHIKYLEEDDEKINLILKEISIILKKDKPPSKQKRKFCKNCAYFDFCMA